MVEKYVYAPHYDFYINKLHVEEFYEMKSFHLHKKYEIYYLIKGKRNYFIGDSSYIINPGNLVLIDKDEVHKTVTVDEVAYSRIVLNFNEEYVLPIIQQFKNLDILDIFKTKVLYLSEEQQQNILKIFDFLIDTYEDNTPTIVAKRQLKVSELLIYIYECLEEQKASELRPLEINKEIIKDITSYISENYKEKLTLDSISDNFGLSTYYLSRMFKSVTNISMTEYINGVRLREAKTLLEETTLGVEDIAKYVGYSTTTHFSRTFKSSIGISPQNYRKLCKRFEEYPK